MVISSELTLICKPIGIQIEDQESSGQIARLLHRHLIFLFRVTIKKKQFSLKFSLSGKQRAASPTWCPVPNKQWVVQYRSRDT